MKTQALNLQRRCICENHCFTDCFIASLRIQKRDKMELVTREYIIY